jgi:uncharacterized protein (TIGR03435 family)
MGAMRWCVALIAATLVLQSRSTGQSAFDVASVKPNGSGDQRVSMGFTPGGYAASNVPLGLVVLSAYGVRPEHIGGAPGWMSEKRFDISAKASGPASRETLMSMLRALLAERFKLAARVEMRDQPIYALVPARSDGRPGPRLKASERECAPGTVLNPCRISGTIGAAEGTVMGIGQAMFELAGYLGRNADRAVVDRTGLQGRFDFELAWSGGDLNAGLFTAVRDQLGLELQPARGQVPFVVIDHVELPAPD